MRAAIAALLLAAVEITAQTRPAFSFRDGVIGASLPASVLQEKSVRKHLVSGLTTTFLLVARLRDVNRVSAARMEVRYDLWDEVWLVTRIEFDGKIDRQRLSSQEALEKWWRAPVRLLHSAAPRAALQIDLTVLPFSAAEQEDARAWITKSGGMGMATGAGIVDALVGTTLSAKPIHSYRWNVDLRLR